MNETDKRPKCPECGDRATVVTLHGAMVHCRLDLDGSLQLPAKAVGPARDAIYKCENGHAFHSGWEKRP